ncbi:hypothetical protein FAZ19_10005 [Sphingobacterium alkalisoli]|uniref:Uncharacterized protein n=1 Tax=Sphingobacterium alkalisoli TaxID=1874115 RepID=A0A4U0H1K0_9SPHI|nr:hypothetical protein [Sphingobacterium alkalisoli]TJY65467.1 hypothetical protein FAZ19_10005 [Sphingobacterium alkalisoli]GGH20277.1 hypothetical protein GCM10011418_25350 [Sphingobacterium alkalisoli]
MLRTDFEVIRNVYDLLGASALSDEDVSFLLGKPNGYFFEVLNPTDKSKFKQDLWTLFVPIFQTPFVNVLPPTNVGSAEEVKLTSAANYNNKSTIYRFTVTYEDGTATESFEWRKSIVTGERKKENKELTGYLKFLISEAYFLKPKNALFILIHLRKFFDKPFTVEDIAVSIKKLCRRQAGITTLLQRNTDNSRYTYSEAFDISTLDEFTDLPSELQDLASNSSVTNRYIIKHERYGALGFVELNERTLVKVVIHPDFREMRLASRLLDHVMDLDKKTPLTVELSVDSPLVDFLYNCSFAESDEDRKFRIANKLTTVKMKRGTDKEGK